MYEIYPVEKWFWGATNFAMGFAMANYPLLSGGKI